MVVNMNHLPDDGYIMMSDAAGTAHETWLSTLLHQSSAKIQADVAVNSSPSRAEVRHEPSSCLDFRVGVPASAIFGKAL